MKKTDISVSLRDGVRKRLKQYSRLLSLSLSASFLLLTLLWQNPAFSQGNCSLGCHGAQVSLGIDCTAKITTAMIADTSQCTNGNFTVYVITLTGDTLENATVTGANIGQTLIASVHDNNSGNSCWSYITVQDKLPPVLDCQCTPVAHIEGALSAADPSTNLSFACMQFAPLFLTPVAGSHYYDKWNFRIAQAGMYTFTFQGTLSDALGAIYSTNFDPNNVCVNLLGGDDDTGNNLDPYVVIQLNMVPGNYILLTSTWDAAGTGSYSWWISGPGDVFNGADDCFVKCTDIDINHPIPTVVDNCTQNATPILINEQVQVLCDPHFVKKLTRWWTAKDASGNRADTCKQVFYLERINFADVNWPDSATVSLGNPFICDANFTDEDGDGIPDAVPVEDGGAGVPTINGVPIYPDFMFYCNSSVWFQDVPIHNPNSCVHKVMRVWTLNEWHCQGERDTLYSQLIEVVDNQGPTIICPPGFTHTTEGHDCNANIWMPAATVTDNCSDINSVTVTYPGGFKNQNGNFYALLPVGNNVITYTAYDKCYNSSQCTMTIVVEDQTPPVAICDAHTVVSLTLGGPHGLTKVPADVFDDGSYDGCGPVTFRAWRMNSCIDFDWTTNGAGEDQTPDGQVNSRDKGMVPRTKVPFACCDAGAGPIMVVLEVTDASGNTNTCMVEVQVQDKIKPHITCPSDITISCDYPLNVDNLSAFGNVVLDQHDVHTWCIYDPTNPNSNHDGFVCGTDGIATDNCDVEVRVTNEPFINNCGIGYIKRTWTALDASGSDACIQYIYVHNYHPITTDNIDWPDDFHGLECALGTDPDELSYPYDKPRVDEDACDLIGIAHEDLVFPIVDGACFKILRTWKIIDWCQYEQYGGLVDNVNYWQHTQILKVVNQYGPVFTTDQPKIDRCNNFDCGGLYLELIQRAEDDCTPGEQLQWTYAVDLNNDQTIDIGPITGLGDVIDASGTYPLGHHRIIYSFEDRCGNRTVREQLLNLNSCKAPVPVCIHGLSTDLMAFDSDGDGHPDSGMITIWAKDFNASSYHPCGAYFTYSLAPDTTVKSLTFDCADALLDSVPVNLYVTDLLGNQAYCQTYIVVDDNNHVCPQGGGLLGTITGNVSTETSDNVLNVQVQINGSNLLPISTNGNGLFTFPAMQPGGNYTVVPDKNNDWKNGVSTLDLVDIQKHLLGIKPLSSPFKMIAADANNSKSITAIDLVELRKLILGIYSELPYNSSWRFVDKGYSFPDSYNPWSQVWPETHQLSPLSQGMNTADFYGIKVGDVNNTVKANANSITPRGSGEILGLVVDDRTIASGATVEVPVYANTDGSIEGLQFSFDLGTGLQFVGVKPGILDVTEDNFGWINNSIITSSWNKAQGVKVDQKQPLFTLMLKADHTARLSEAITLATAPTHPEAYTVESDIMDLGLTFRGTEASYTFELLQNEPNPFNGSTQIGYVIPESGQVTLTLFDLTGRELFKQTLNGNKGLNKFEVLKDQIGAQGVVYYQVQFQGYTATKKMLIL
jgi:hypothetical protein